MAGSVKCVSGWMDRNEWECVYHELYSGDPVLLKHAVDRIAIWKCRLLHKLSTAIEVTWELINAQLFDLESKMDGKCLETNEQVCLTYGMALVRFVNLLTEKGQRSQYSIPVHVIAGDMGLPEWLVDLRHDTTHASLPSYHILKAGTSFALSWLKREYWDAQIKADKQSSHKDKSPKPVRLDSMKDALAEEDVTQMLMAYLQEQFYLLEKDTSSSGQEKIPGKQMIHLGKIIAANEICACKVLCQDGFLTPTPGQYSSLGLEVTDSNELLPEKVVIFWKPLLKILHNLKIIPKLLHMLALSQNQDNSLRNRLLAGWIIALVTAADKRGNRATVSSPSVTELLQLFNQKYFLDGGSLLETCLEHPNKYTHHLLPSLFPLQSPPLDSKCKMQLLELVKLYTQDPVMNNDDTGCDLQTVDLEGLRAQINEACFNQEDMDTIPIDHNSAWTTDITCFNEENKDTIYSCRNSAWKRDSSSIDWSKIPIGAFPGSADRYTCLELPECVDVNAKHNPLRENITKRKEVDDKIESECQLPLWSKDELLKITQDIAIF